MHLVGAPNRLDRSLAQPDVAHFPLTYELGHRANGVFYRRVPVDAMLVVEIDCLDAQALERSFAGLTDVLGFAVDTEKRARLGVADVSKLCSEDHLVAFPLDGAANQLLIRVRAIH